MWISLGSICMWSSCLLLICRYLHLCFQKSSFSAGVHSLPGELRTEWIFVLFSRRTRELQQSDRSSPHSPIPFPQPLYIVWSHRDGPPVQGWNPRKLSRCIDPRKRNFSAGHYPRMINRPRCQARIWQKEKNNSGFTNTWLAPHLQRPLQVISLLWSFSMYI